MNQYPGMEAVQEVIRRLLSPDGCPWDREQTPETLCDYLIEETFELAGAVRSRSRPDIMEEMGDVFFLLLFMAHFYRDDFSLDQVWHKNAAKMISRHPHVFENQHFETRDELLRNWEQAKKKEKSGGSTSPFASIPKNLPPLLMAYRICSKAARTGFTWKTDQDVENKLAEEWQEFEDADKNGDAELAEQEFGDYLFTLVEMGRRRGIKANSALSRTNLKFLGRFEKMQHLALKKGLDFSELSLELLDALWEEVKAGEPDQISGEQEEFPSSF